MEEDVDIEILHFDTYQDFELHLDPSTRMQTMRIASESSEALRSEWETKFTKRSQLKKALVVELSISPRMQEASELVSDLQADLTKVRADNANAAAKNSSLQHRLQEKMEEASEKSQMLMETSETRIKLRAQIAETLAARSEMNINLLTKKADMQKILDEAKAETARIRIELQKSRKARSGKPVKVSEAPENRSGPGSSSRSNADLATLLRRDDGNPITRQAVLWLG